MRKRLATIFMIAALLVTSCSFELFAETGTNDEGGAPNTETTDETPETNGDGEEEPAVKPADPVDEESTEEPAAEETAEPAANDKENAETQKATLKAPATRGVATVTGITLSSSNVTATSATLSWSVTTDPEGVSPGEALVIYQDGTEVYRTDDPIGNTTTPISGLEQNKEYTFTAEIGGKTAECTVKTPAVQVPDFRSVSSYKAVYLRWSAVSGAAKYEITCSNGLKGTVNAGSKLEWKHSGINPKDIINLYNTGSGSKFSGNLNGKDRYTYTIKALDSNGKVLAQSTTTGDIVKTLYYKLTFKKGATLTSHSGGKVKIKVKKGAVVYARGFTEGKYIFDYKCKDGKIRTFHTMKIRVKASLSKHIVASKKNRGKSSITYSAEEAEQYINDRGIKSETKYMIWANLFTQKEYIFYSKTKGKKKDWKLVTANVDGKKKLMSALPVSTGKASMPTATGKGRISNKLKSQHGTPLWNLTKYFSVHGVQKKWPKVGWPESGACVRNQMPNARWIYANIPMYTRVFVH